MKRFFCALLALLMLLMPGCGSETAKNTVKETKEDRLSWLPGTAEKSTEQTTEPTVAPTVPENGNPDDVTCKGSYTAEVTDAVIAKAGGAELTNEELQVWYWAEVALWQQ